MLSQKKNANKPKGINAAFKLYDELTKEQKKIYEKIDFNLISKLLWIDLSRKDFDLLIKVVDDNLNNKSYKTGVAGNDHDLKNAKTFLQDISIKKIVKMKRANCTTV